MVIVLTRPTQQPSADSTVAKFVHPPCYTAGPYVLAEHPRSLAYVPPLAYFCIRVLASMPEQAHKLETLLALRYSSPDDAAGFDILRALIPSFGDPTFSLSRVDPRLWATLAQLYKSTLPDEFSHYALPLSDAHLPLLQSIASTREFSLVTILELPGCSDLDDGTVHHLRALNTLVALEASGTKLTDYGIRTLSKTLAWTDGAERRGPWPLRILRLRDCKGITGQIIPIVSKFPLLSVLDLRGTKCWTSCAKASPWTQGTHAELYHPIALRASLSFLDSLSSGTLFSSPAHFHLCINTLQYSRTYETVKRQTTSRRHQYANVTTRDSVTLVHKPIDAGPSMSSAVDERETAAPRWMETVVNREFDNLIEKQSINAFYFNAPRSRQVVLSSAEAAYQAQEGSFRSSSNSSAAFYRSPPPWSDLDLQRPPPERVVPVPPAQNKNKKPNMKLDAEKARRMTTWQSSFTKKPSLAAPPPPGPPKLEDALKGGNPFRRKSEPQAVPPASLLKPVPRQVQEAPAPSGSATTSKRVRPISSLDVPPLPEDEKKKLKDSSRRESLPSSKAGKGRSSLPAPPPAKKAKFDMKGWLKPKAKEF